MKPSFINKFGLNLNHILCLVFLLVCVITLPIFFFYSKVFFDPALFLTEYEKIVWEGLVIGCILTFVGLLLEHKRESTTSKIFLQNNLYISKEDLSTLIRQELSNINPDNFNVTPIAKFHWDVIHSFFSERKYYLVKNDEIVRRFFELHANFVNEGSIEIACGYFNAGHMRKIHLDFVIKLLDSINSVYENKA